MIITEEEIIEKALQMPPEKRAKLAGILEQSIIIPEEDEIEKAWENEAMRRIAEYKCGKMKTLTAEEAFGFGV